MANILFLILGLQIGYWAKEVYVKLKEIREKQEENKAYGQAGVTRAKGQPIQQIDLTSKSGGIRRPTPENYVIANMKERDERLKRM